MDEYQVTSDALQQTWIYLPPLIVAIGTVGNFLTLVTVTSRQCKKSSFTVYLGALAIFDTLVLYTVGTQMWMRLVFGVNIADLGTFMCKWYFFTSFLFPQTSSWLVVALTVERTVGTYFPLQYKLINRPRTGLLCVAVIFVFLLCLNSHLLYGSEMKDFGNVTLCYFFDDSYADFFFYYWARVDFCVYCILPITFIITANVATVLRVIKSVRSGIRASSSASPDSIRQRTRYLLMVTLTVSITFVVLASPLSFWVALAPFVVEDLNTLTSQETILESVFYFLLFLNHSLNFFMYMVSGPRFRKELKAVVKGCVPFVNAQ